MLHLGCIPPHEVDERRSGLLHYEERPHDEDHGLLSSFAMTMRCCWPCVLFEREPTRLWSIWRADLAVFTSASSFTDLAVAGSVFATIKLRTANPGTRI